MKRLGMVGLAVAMFAALLWAQDKSAPAPRGAVENKFVMLADNEAFAAKDKIVGKAFMVDTAGYTEARVVVYAVGMNDKGANAPIGGAAKREVEMYPHMSNGKWFSATKSVQKATESPTDPSSTDVVTYRISSPKTNFVVRFKEVDCDKIVYNVEVYLIK